MLLGTPHPDSGGSGAAVDTPGANTQMGPLSDDAVDAGPQLRALRLGACWALAKGSCVALRVAMHPHMRYLGRGA